MKSSEANALRQPTFTQGASAGPASRLPEDPVHRCELGGMSAFNLSKHNGWCGFINRGRKPFMSKNSQRAMASRVVTYQSTLSRAIVIPGAPSSWVNLGSVGDTDTGSLSRIKVKPLTGHDSSASYTCYVDATQDRTGSVADYFPGGQENAAQCTWFKAMIEVDTPSNDTKGLTADSDVPTV